MAILNINDCNMCDLGSKFKCCCRNLQHELIVYQLYAVSNYGRWQENFQNSFWFWFRRNIKQFVTRWPICTWSRGCGRQAVTLRRKLNAPQLCCQWAKSWGCFGMQCFWLCISNVAVDFMVTGTDINQINWNLAKCQLIWSDQKRAI